MGKSGNRFRRCGPLFLQHFLQPLQILLRDLGLHRAMLGTTHETNMSIPESGFTLPGPAQVVVCIPWIR